LGLFCGCEFDEIIFHIAWALVGITVRLGTLLREVELRPAQYHSFPAPPGSALVFSGLDNAYAYLRRFADADATTRLRQLLVHDGHHDVQRLGDDEVWRQVASLLCQRRLILVEGGVEDEHIVNRSAGTPIEQAETPIIEERAMLHAVWKSPSQPSLPPTPAEPNPLDSVDHDLQAAALRQAAQNGTPFCEECLKAARAHAA